MTAVSIVAQPEAAYILCDGALYDDDAVIRAIASKWLIADAERLALVPSGRCTSVDIATALEALSLSGQDAIMQALPDVARAHRDRNVAAGLTEPDLQLFVALWSDRNDEAQVWMLSTCALPHWGPYAPCTWLRVDSMIGTSDVLAAVLDRREAEAATIEMEVDGLTILQHQRHTMWPDGRHYVGGRGELVRVARDGITTRRLVDWPDAVGRRIAP